MPYVVAFLSVATAPLCAGAEPLSDEVAALRSADDRTADRALSRLLARQAPEALPLLLDGFENLSEPRTIVRTLRAVAPLCDATCVPALALALRSNSQSVVLAACSAARQNALPELRPALLEHASHNQNPSIRYEATRALDSSGTDNFETLFALVDPEKPDSAALHIVRSIPPNRLADYVDTYSRLATNEAFATSAVSAFSPHPEWLFERLIQMPLDDIPEAERETALMSMRRLAGGVAQKANAHDGGLHEAWPQIALALLENARRAHDEDAVRQIARIMAPFRDMFTSIVRLSYINMDAFSTDVVASIIRELPPASVADLLDLLSLDDGLTNEPFGRKKLLNFSSPDPAVYALFVRMTDVPEAAPLSLVLDATYSSDNRLAGAAIEVLARKEPGESTRQRLTSLLGHHVAGETAARALARDAEFHTLPANISDDMPGASLYARWAAAAATMQGATISNAIDDAAAVLNNPRRRHALPALAMFIATRTPPPPLTPEVRKTLAGETQRLWLRAACVSHSVTVDDIREALALPYTAPEALRCLIGMLDEDAGDFDATTTLDDAELARLILNRQPSVALRAETFAMKCAEHHASPGQLTQNALLQRLYDADERIPHNALHALRAMHALPARETLAALAARAHSDMTKGFIAFLLGVPRTDGRQTRPSLFPNQLNDNSIERDHTIITNGLYDSVDHSKIAVRFGF